MCRSVTHPCVLFLIVFWKLRQEQRKMDGGNCSSMTGFIFLGITDNTEHKVTILTMVLIVYLIGYLANLGMIFLIRTPSWTPSCTHPCTFPLVTSPLCPLLFHCSSPWDALGPICQEQINPLLWLCSAILGLLYLCWLWVSPAGSHGLRPVQGHQQPLALCGQRVQPDVPPARGWGLSGGNGTYSDTHNISISLMFLWVRWD